MDLESLVVVGDEVVMVPASASGSLKPLTISRAFALGLPSSFSDHFKRIPEVKVLDSSASAVVWNAHTPWSKKDFSSLTLASLNSARSCGPRSLSLTPPCLS